MGANESSLLSFLFLSGLGAVLLYLGKIFNDFQEDKRKFISEFLPSLDKCISSFIKAKDTILDLHFDTFLDKIKNIDRILEEQTSSNKMRFFKKDFKKKLIDFNSNIHIFQSILEQSKEMKGINQIVKSAFEEDGINLVSINPHQLLTEATNIHSEIEHQKSNIKSLVFHFYMIILTFLLGIAAAAVEYFKT